MNEPAPMPLNKALTTGLSEVTLARTLELFQGLLMSNNNRALNFRGDLAERFNYDKIQPVLRPVRTEGYVVIMEGISQTTGQTGLYQILANQWKLLEVLAKLD